MLMIFESLFNKITRKLKTMLSFFVFQYLRIIKYKILSNCKKVEGKPKFNQPALIAGQGMIFFGNKVTIGVSSSPLYYNGYAYIEARKEFSKISFGENVWINNSCSFISEGAGIQIGDNTLMGINCEFIDSDFHELTPHKRMSGTPQTAKITIGRNVFIGSNVKVLKGVTIGDNSVIANGSVVTKSIPGNVIAGGNPAKILKDLE